MSKGHQCTLMTLGGIAFGGVMAEFLSRFTLSEGTSESTGAFLCC
jgi:hypothetical protein